MSPTFEPRRLWVLPFDRKAGSAVFDQQERPGPVNDVRMRPPDDLLSSPSEVFEIIGSKSFSPADQGTELGWAGEVVGDAVPRGQLAPGNSILGLGVQRRNSFQLPQVVQWEALTGQPLVEEPCSSTVGTGGLVSDESDEFVPVYDLGKSRQNTEIYAFPFEREGQV